MYLSETALAGLEARYGRPALRVLRQEIGRQEMDNLLQSQKFGRAHDATFFIFDQRGLVALIRKPGQPPGVYRAPSGGILPGEDLESGILREALEETGLTISLKRYLLRLKATFTSGERSVDWTSHICTAAALDSELEPRDREEIAEARWGSLEELQGPIREALLRSGKGLLRYRALLTDEVCSLLQAL